MLRRPPPARRAQPCRASLAREAPQGRAAAAWTASPPLSKGGVMPSATTFLAFGLVAFGMVLTPGPNMIYVLSRSITQGPLAGLISLAGVMLGFIVYVLCAAFGITALVFAVPY